MTNLLWEKLNSKPEKIGFKYATIKTFKLPNGKEDEYTTWDKEGYRATAAVAITTDGKVVIAEQFRPGPEIIMDELPGGFVEENESPDKAAIRELKEETGYTSDSKPQLLGICHKSAYTNVKHYYYLVTDCKKTDEQNLDSNEFVNIKLLTITDLVKNAHNGKMTDAAAVFMAYHTLQNLEGNI